MCGNLEIQTITDYLLGDRRYHYVYSCKILKGKDQKKKKITAIRNKYKDIGGANCLPLGTECPFYANNTMRDCRCFVE